jgi:hypothetical protein
MDDHASGFPAAPFCSPCGRTHPQSDHCTRSTGFIALPSQSVGRYDSHNRNRLIRQKACVGIPMASENAWAGHVLPESRGDCDLTTANPTFYDRACFKAAAWQACVSPLVWRSLRHQ